MVNAVEARRVTNEQREGEMRRLVHLIGADINKSASQGKSRVEIDYVPWYLKNDMVSFLKDYGYVITTLRHTQDEVKMEVSW